MKRIDWGRGDRDLEGEKIFDFTAIYFHSTKEQVI